MKKFITELKATLNTTVQNLSAIVEGLPAELKAKIAAPRDAVVQALAGIQIDDADDTALPTALEVLSRSHAAVLSSLESLGAQASETQKSLNRLAELDDRLAKGELVEKTKVTDLVNSARAEGEQAARAAVQLLASRREQLVTDKLPNAPEAALEGTDEEFAARLEKAKTRTQELSATGISLNGAIGQSVWAEDQIYQRDLALVKELRAAPGPNPFAGGGSGGSPKPSGMI